ncbi:MAG: LamG domain-containing protein [bacterium]
MKRYQIVARVIFVGLAICFAAPSQADNWSTVPLGKWAESRSLQYLAPEESTGTWTEKEGILAAVGAGAQWSTRLLPGDQGGGQKVTLKFTVQKSAGTPFSLPGGCSRWSFYWGENQPGWDLGVVLRFKDPLNFYRVQVSATRGQLALWDSTGAFLQIVPCAVTVNEPHTLEITARGAHFQVSLEGKAVLDYWDRTLPHTGGQAGLAVYQSTTSIESFSLEKVKAESAAMPPHKPDFHFVSGAGPVLYDGNEPISYFHQNPRDKTLTHEAVKLKPGWRPTYYTAIGPALSEIGLLPLVGKFPDAFKIEGGGETLTFSFATEKPGVAHTDYTVTVRFDATRGVYRYEYRGKMKVGDQPLVNLSSFEWLDPLCYNNRTAGPEVIHRWNSAGHRWNVYQGVGDAWRRYPIVDFLEAYNNPKMAWGKFKDFLYPDPAACPAFETEIGWEQTKNRGFVISQCTWGYDYHHAEVGDGITLPPGTERALNMTLTALPPDEADKLFAQSQLPDAMAKDATKLIPFDPRGTSFSKTTTWRDPGATMVWGGGVLDETTGHGDRASLRIDGPDKAALHMYQYIIEQNAKRWWVRGWFKTKGLRGRGAELKVKYAYDKKPIEAFYMGGLGDQDWTPFSFITTAPAQRDCTDVIFEADGPGTVWLDDVAFSALKEGENPEVTNFPVPSGFEPNKEVLIDLPMNVKPGKAVYDESRNGHALQLTNVQWEQEKDDRRFISFNGSNSMGRLPLKAVLEPSDSPPGTTGNDTYKPIFPLKRFAYEFWARPHLPARKEEGRGMVFHYRDNPRACFEAFNAKSNTCLFVWQNNLFHGNKISLSLSVPLDQWLHFVITHGDGKVILYVNGKKSGEAEYDASGPGFNFFAYQWEFFFGCYLREAYWYTGDLGPFRLYSKALTSEEVIQRFQKAGP